MFPVGSALKRTNSQLGTPRTRVMDSGSCVSWSRLDLLDDDEVHIVSCCVDNLRDRGRSVHGLPRAGGEEGLKPNKTDCEEENGVGHLAMKENIFVQRHQPRQFGSQEHDQVSQDRQDDQAAIVAKDQSGTSRDPD